VPGHRDRPGRRGRRRRAAICGAFVVSTTGDWEGLSLRRALGLVDDPDVLR
jgi:hypothetical protein